MKCFLFLSEFCCHRCDYLPVSVSLCVLKCESHSLSGSVQRKFILCAWRWYDKAPRLNTWGVAAGNTLLLINLRVLTLVCSPSVCVCACVHLTHPVMSVVSLRSVIQVWVCCLRMSDFPFSHSHLHKNSIRLHTFFQMLSQIIWVLKPFLFFVPAFQSDSSSPHPAACKECSIFIPVCTCF